MSPSAQHTENYGAKLSVTEPGELYKEIAQLLRLATEAQTNVTNRPESILEPRIAHWSSVFRKHVSRKEWAESLF